MIKFLLIFALLNILGIISCSKENVSHSEFIMDTNLITSNCGGSKIKFTKDSLLRDLSLNKCITNNLYLVDKSLEADEFHQILTFIDALELMTLNHTSEALTNDNSIIEILIQYHGKKNRFSFGIPVKKANEIKYQKFLNFILDKYRIQN
ncbi:hypothetical protein ACFRAE_08820 [Sphingobacterium sp. HJSM2_6]|uniref:hypothetical protein n=1 Tax=Sphingobacterium sp. HJSM2_6 TaxID=3366264 RepID=UPI003BBAF5C4